MKTIIPPDTRPDAQPAPPQRDSEGHLRLSDEKLRELAARFNAKSWNEAPEPEDADEKPR